MFLIIWEDGSINQASDAGLAPDIWQAADDGTVDIVDVGSIFVKRYVGNGEWESVETINGE